MNLLIDYNDTWSSKNRTPSIIMTLNIRVLYKLIQKFWKFNAL